MVPATGKLTVNWVAGTHNVPQPSVHSLQFWPFSKQPAHARFCQRPRPTICVVYHLWCVVRPAPRAGIRRVCDGAGAAVGAVGPKLAPDARRATAPLSWQIASPALTQVSRHLEGGSEDRDGGSGTSAAFASTAAKLVRATTLALANGVQMHASRARSSEEADIGGSNQFSRGTQR